MAEDIKGDVYYVDPTGRQWKIVRRPAERHRKDYYWHADLLGREVDAHRVSVSMHRLLTGIDAIQWESDHDGGTQENNPHTRHVHVHNTATAHREESRSPDASATRQGGTSYGTTERHGEESRRQAHLY